MTIKDDDPRLAFIYQEALRGLQLQQTSLESLRNRAATLIFATSFVTSLFGGYALANGVGAWDWIAIGLLLGIGILTTIMLWPYYNLTFRFDVQDLLATYIDSSKPATMSDMYREMALQIKQNWHENGHVIKRLRMTFQISLICLLLETLAWMTSISGIF
jgi:uncharacterized membrane protein